MGDESLSFVRWQTPMNNKRTNYKQSILPWCHIIPVLCFPSRQTPLREQSSLLLQTSSSLSLSVTYSNWLPLSLQYSLLKGVSDLTLLNPRVIFPFLSSLTSQQHLRVYSILSETLSCCSCSLFPCCHNLDAMVSQARFFSLFTRSLQWISPSHWLSVTFLHQRHPSLCFWSTSLPRNPDSYI